MSKSKLTWYKSKARLLLKLVKCEKRQDIANLINESQQTISYRIGHQYQEQLEDWLRILDFIGYEVREKDESISD